MRILRTTEGPLQEDARTRPSVCCIGTFDGVHLGHQQLIRAAVNEARASNAPAVVVTFFPNPRVVLGRAPDRYLTQPEEKADLLRGLGVDVLLIQTFDTVTIATTAEQFISQLQTAFGLRSLWLGPDFAMGNKRQGTPEYLAGLGARDGFDVHVLPQLSIGAGAVSSTRIREALDRSDIADAVLCLGRPYRVPVTVQEDGAWCTGGKRWLPEPGRYRVLIDGTPGDVVVPANSDCEIQPAVPRSGLAPGTRLEIDFA
jgi:riboflavin kinase/FMN adenylyltransferase